MNTKNRGKKGKYEIKNEKITQNHVKIEYY